MTGRRIPRLWERTTGELLVLMVAGTVCFSVLATGATIAIVQVVHPEVDTDAAWRAVNGVINTMIGLLAGFLAGRTDAHTQHPSSTHDEPVPVTRR